MNTNTPRGPRAGWFRLMLAVAALVWIMVAIGGATRLTGSGLSIMEWAPVAGFLPPLSEAEAIETALAAPDVLMVNRNAGAGTRILIDRLLAGQRPPGYANQPKSHNAVAAAISQGRADWGIAIAAAATLYGLGFLPIAPEHYDFLVVEARRDRPAVQAFLAALQDPAVRDRIRAAGMQLADD